MFRSSLRPSSGGQTAFSLPVVFCPVVTVGESRLAGSPTSQQSQQDRKPQAVKTQSDLLTMGVKTPETC